MVGTLRFAHPTESRFFTVIARSDSDETIHLSACPGMDCFASLAMTTNMKPPHSAAAPTIAMAWRT